MSAILDTTEPLQLRSDVVAHPLVNHWYAWSHLVAPATAALNVSGRHIKIMRSFLQQPAIHLAAAQTPALAGGPFMKLAPDRASEVAWLLEETLRRQAPLLVLADAISSLRDVLRREARGTSLEPLYRQVPEPLRGYVELVYDAENRPGYRLIESLLYRSPFYQPDVQAFSLARVAADDRPFVLSTPMLGDAHSVHVELPFDSDGIRFLLEATDTPRKMSDLTAALGVSQSDTPRFEALFTSALSRPAPPFAGPGVRIRYFGHACLMIEAAGVSLLTDPIISPASDAAPVRYSWSDLPEAIDYVLITHNHKDHFLLETLLRLRHRIRGAVIVPRDSGGDLQDPSLRLVLRAAGFKLVQELTELEELALPSGGRLVGVPFFGEHGDLDVRSKLAFFLELGGQRLLIAADSNNIEPSLYRHLRAVLGRIDTLFLGMECDGAPLSWLYGPLLSAPLDRSDDQARRLTACDDVRAWRLVEALGCREVRIYAMGLEPWLRFLTATEYGEETLPMQAVRRLLETLRASGIAAECCFGMREWHTSA